LALIFLSQLPSHHEMFESDLAPSLQGPLGRRRSGVVSCVTVDVDDNERIEDDGLFGAWKVATGQLSWEQLSFKTVRVLWCVRFQKAIRERVIFISQRSKELRQGRRAGIRGNNGIDEEVGERKTVRTVSVDTFCQRRLVRQRAFGVRPAPLRSFEKECTPYWLVNVRNALA
jgi:hypothetical protein